ncbi:MAG: insulinase family protein [Myxococcales bacterium]|nr:insulinase family protein [Myxococcales bacterium]
MQASTVKRSSAAGAKKKAPTEEASGDDRWIERLNARAKSKRARVTREPSVSFGAETIQRFRLGNGLSVLLVESHHAKVVSFHTWFGVGSRHEHEGKTGLAHLFEHLMFNETKNLPAGTFDRKLESIGASTNAATWNDWTYYYEDLPSDALSLVVALESERMKNLVLRKSVVDNEIGVVANERRYRVEDDVDGTVNELLYKTAFDTHPYHHPTIGWMSDILAFTPEDCKRFYRTFYAPNNARIVVVGDTKAPELLALVQKHYGDLASAELPREAYPAEPEQREERVERLVKPTPTAKVAIGYKCPALAHPDNAALSVLCEALFGGRSARIFRALVTEAELATDLAASVSQFRDPGLFELYATAREGISVEVLLAGIDHEIKSVLSKPVTAPELERSIARQELGFLQGLETVGGRAEQIGFYDTVLGDPAGSLTRLTALRSVTLADVERVAREYLVKSRRTVVLVEPSPAGEPSDGESDGGDE